VEDTAESMIVEAWLAISRGKILHTVVCFFVCSDLGKAEKELNAWIGRHFRRRHCPVVTSLLRLHKERTLPILSPDRVSMSALDYSKWDNLEDSDDEDQDGRGGAADEVGNSLLVHGVAARLCSTHPSPPPHRSSNLPPSVLENLGTTAKRSRSAGPSARRCAGEVILSAGSNTACAVLFVSHAYGPDTSLSRAAPACSGHRRWTRITCPPRLPTTQ
jgi:hypothetical protein